MTSIIMRSLLLAYTLPVLSAAEPQPPWGISSPFPFCMSACYGALRHSAHRYQCNSSIVIVAFNSCVDASSCGTSDKNKAYQDFAQLCTDSGTNVTAPAEATFSITDANIPWPSQWSSFTGSKFSSWTSVPSSSNWNGPGPFGGRDNGWGEIPWTSDGPLASGPWTSWWGDRGCPTSTWSGWTNALWVTNAPWTSWTACAATTTATSLVTRTVTVSGAVTVETSTDYGVRVNQASKASSATGDGNEAGAMDVRMAGSVAGTIGMIAGALLL